MSALRVIAAIDARERTSPRAAKQVLRQLFEFRDSQQGGPERTEAADHGGRTVMAAPDVVGDEWSA